jgi:alkanesulfonate monooxygenase SsuD/methylene tetrahydromethanopterin reductase-like flavin-dependent oxidoreductase (luciferase family)
MRRRGRCVQERTSDDRCGDNRRHSTVPIRGDRADQNGSADVARPHSTPRRQRLLDAPDAGLPVIAAGAPPTLALAAALTDLRVGTWVYASPLRPAWSTAWEAYSLTVVTEGRFEMGVGTGRAGDRRRAPDLGMPVVPLSERLTHVRESVTMLPELDGPDLHTPIVMAVHGPKAWALAAELADTVTFALMPGEARADVEQRVRDFGATRDVELSQHVAVISDAVAPFMARPDTDPAALRAADSLAILPMTRRPRPRSSSGVGRSSASPTRLRRRGLGLTRAGRG